MLVYLHEGEYSDFVITGILRNDSGTHESLTTIYCDFDNEIKQLVQQLELYPVNTPQWHKRSKSVSLCCQALVDMANSNGLLEIMVTYTKQKGLVFEKFLSERLQCDGWYHRPRPNFANDILAYRLIKDHKYSLEDVCGLGLDPVDKAWLYETELYTKNK